MKPCACWILCTPRTGSSILCELLNNLGVYPNFDHPDMKMHRGPLEVGQAFNEWPRLYANPVQFCHHPAPYSKMIFHQYVEVMGSVPKNKQYNIGWYPEKHDKEMMAKVSKKYNSEFARSIFPDIKFIHLKRDVMSHAISLYFARMTKKYHIYDKNSYDNYINLSINYEKNRLLECYADALDYEKSWNYFLNGSECIYTLNYSDLIKDMQHSFSEIVDFLGCGGDVLGSINKAHGEDKRIYRMTRPEAAEYEAKLRKILSLKFL